MPSGILLALFGIGVFLAGEPKLQPVDRGLLDSEDLLRVLWRMRGMYICHGHHIHLGRLMKMAQATVDLPLPDNLSNPGRLTHH